MALIEIESEDKNEPELSFSCNVEMTCDNFTKAVEDCSIVADSCSLISGAGFFIIEGSGSLNSARAEFSGDEAKINGVGKAKYSLEYLMKFIKAAKIADKVRINFSDDYPLRLDYAGEKMGMGFILAPRVEND
jgi:proliferating cell nuclear antigen